MPLAPEAYAVTHALERFVVDLTGMAVPPHVLLRAVGLAVDARLLADKVKAADAAASADHASKKGKC